MGHRMFSRRVPAETGVNALTRAVARVRASGTRDELLAAHADPEWELHADADTGWVRGLPGIEVLHFDGGRARFRGFLRYPVRVS